ncbi:hypothetical protein LEMLEM_LOCUS11179 [Lemmus lemmus]
MEHPQQQPQCLPVRKRRPREAHPTTQPNQRTRGGEEPVGKTKSIPAHSSQQNSKSTSAVPCCCADHPTSGH